MKKIQAVAHAVSYTPESPISELVVNTETPYHTDKFITGTLNFKPTQVENILRSNFNEASNRVLNNQFDGDNDDFVSIKDVYRELFPDIKTFIDYLQARTPNSKFPVALSFIISRKADVDDKRKEIHELGLAEMRSIFEMPTEVPNPDYDPDKAEVCKNNGEHYGIPEFITDHKTLALKVNVFKHLDGQKNKQEIQNQNIQIKINQLNLNGGNSGKNNGPKNPTLIGYGDVLPHKLAAPKRRANANTNSPMADTGQSPPVTQPQSPKEILDGIINDESDIIDVTPTKEELLKQDEQVLAERLTALRAEEAKAMRVPKPVSAKSSTPAPTKSNSEKSVHQPNLSEVPAVTPKSEKGVKSDDIF